MAKKKIKVIDMNNKSISNEAQKEEVHVNKKFVKVVVPKEEPKLLIRNGRVYKKLDNQYGMYADNGEVFKL